MKIQRQFILIADYRECVFTRSKNDTLYKKRTNCLLINYYETILRRYTNKNVIKYRHQIKENDFAVFKNVFNDYYVKDTGKKINGYLKEHNRQSLSTNNGNGYRLPGKINAGQPKPVRQAFSPDLSTVLTVELSSITVPATATKMIRKIISSVPITKAIPVLARFIISVKSRCISGYWNVKS